MKQFILKSVIALICVTFSIDCHAKKIFKDLSSDPDVESVYVGKAMMNLAKGAIKMSGDKDSGAALQAVKGMNSVEIVNCESAPAIERIKAKARKIMGVLKLEVLLETIEKNEQVYIYGIPSTKDKNNTISDMVIESIEPGEYSLIHINGTIDLQKLMEE